MDLYRLDYISECGTKLAPVKQLGMDYLGRRASAARSHAASLTADGDYEILISKISGRNAQVLPWWIVSKNGKARKPTVNRCGPRTRYF